jgi:ABC-type ATPase with predicted acetyltransferase domain
VPSFNIVKETTASGSFRVQSIIGSYDLESSKIVERFSGNIDIDLEWKIGLIFGSSGTGKTTIAKELFGESYLKEHEYKSKSVIDDMPDVPVKQISKMFTSVGFGSVPSWLKPYSVLSNGEKMRVDLANSLLQEEKIIVFDEFTSVVDRNVAKIGSICVQKHIRKVDKKFIAVSCHSDIINWLNPDWLFNTDTMKFSLNKKKDKKSKSIFERPQHLSGELLKSITI